MTESVFSLPGNESLGKRLAAALNASEGRFTLRDFPDGETYVRGETRCDDQDVVVAANLVHPNPQILPLLFAVRAMRDLGARRVILVTPYLPYMRQDARFQPGEVVTSRIFSKLLSDVVDGLVTIDPHLHRYKSLDEIYSIPAYVGHAARPLAEWIREHVEKPLIVGPDGESEQWVSSVASRVGAPYVVLSKSRRGDRDVEVVVPPMDKWRLHTPVLVDDIISTARTMIEAVGHLDALGFENVVCLGVHAVFAGDAYDALRAAGAADIVTCDAVTHPSNRIELTTLLADGVRSLLEASAV